MPASASEARRDSAGRGRRNRTRVSTTFRLRLLGVWQLTRDDQALSIPTNVQRLVTLLALSGPRTRSFVAGMLWPEADDLRAHGSLRTMLWRMHKRWPGLVAAVDDVLTLCDDISIDVHDLVERAEAVIRGATPTPAITRQLATAQELLPGWYEDWVLVERERLRQLRLHAMEALSGRLLDRRHSAEALEAALNAVAIEPLRESAHRLAIRAHLSQGNVADALRQFDHYRNLVRRELGLEPSEHMVALVGDLLRARQVRQRAVRHVAHRRDAAFEPQARTTGRPPDQVSATKGTPGRYAR